MAKGYNAPKMPKGGGGMMGQIQKMQEQMAIAQAELADETVTETVGGGVISITMTGDQHCREVKIAAELLENPDVDMMQDMLLSAINLALDSSRELSEKKMAPFTSMLGGLGF